MSSLIGQYIAPISNFLKSREYREFARLFIKYKDFPRSVKQEIVFLDYKFLTVDTLSFIFQFKHIFVNGMYRFQTSSSAPVIYDCGANVGLSCLYFKKQFPNARIKAFEADPAIAGVLRENMQLNHISGVEVIDKALWIDDKGVEFTVDNADGGSIYSEGDKIKIPSVSLKELLKKENRIDMIKMNVEGAELDLIVDCADELHRAENMYIEYHSFIKQEQQLDKILAILSRNGFRYYIQNVISTTATPLISEIKVDNLDLQLHIFAYKK